MSFGKVSMRGHYLFVTQAECLLEMLCNDQPASSGAEERIVYATVLRISDDQNKIS